MNPEPLQPLTAPPADMGPLTELIGYFAQAVEDGEPLDAQQALDLALETRRRMLAPIHQWMQRMGGPS